MLAVFPEGTTHDEASIRPLRTGVARIALAAAPPALDVVCIVPRRHTYADKVAVRGRALIEFGEPLAVAAAPAPTASADHGRSGGSPTACRSPSRPSRPTSRATRTRSASPGRADQPAAGR